MKNLKKFFKYVIPHKRHLIYGFLFNLLYAVFSSISMVSLFPLMNVLFDDGEKITKKPIIGGISEINKDYLQDYMNYFITTNSESKGVLNTLIWMTTLVLSTFLLKNLFSFFATIQSTFLNNGILRDLRNDVYNKVISLPMAFFSGAKRGDLISRMTGDIGVIKNAFLSVIMMVREPLIIVSTLIAMFFISWKLSIFVIVFIPVSGLLISKLGKTIKSQSSEIFAREGELFHNIEETLGGIRIIKAFTSENFFNRKFFDFTDNITKLNNRIGLRLSLAGPLSEFLGILVIGILLIYGGSLVLIEESLKASEFIPFMGLAYQILTPAKAIAKANHALQGGNAAYERVAFLLETNNTLDDGVDAKVIDSFEYSISFNNVSFKYDNEYVIKDFSLEIPKGKTVAFVGESGSGKSTLANLVTRFYDVSEGSITFDGKNIKNIKKESLRNQMGIVDQDSILFNDSIKNNISLGLENPSMDSIIEAAKVANAHGFISEFEKQYDSPVGDGGGMLSGGQRQRISIARAVMKNPPIMILDEATSALDTESEKIVQDALEKMMQNRTSIVIAHRLSTIQNADLIVVMNKGEIVEKGTHQELIAQHNGTYAKLVKLQHLELS